MAGASTIESKATQAGGESQSFRCKWLNALVNPALPPQRGKIFHKFTLTLAQQGNGSFRARRYMHFGGLVYAHCLQSRFAAAMGISFAF